MLYFSILLTLAACYSIWKLARSEKNLQGHQEEGGRGVTRVICPRPQTVIKTMVTGPAKRGHVGTNYTLSLYRSYLSTGKVYFHSVTCIMMPIKCVLRAKHCSAIA